MRVILIIITIIFTLIIVYSSLEPPCHDQSIRENVAKWQEYVSTNIGIKFRHPVGYAVQETPHELRIFDERPPLKQVRSLLDTMVWHGYWLPLPKDHYDLSRTSGTLLIRKRKETLKSSYDFTQADPYTKPQPPENEWIWRWHLKSGFRGSDGMYTVDRREWALNIYATPSRNSGGMVKAYANVATARDREMLFAGSSSERNWLMKHAEDSYPIIHVEINAKFPVDWYFGLRNCDISYAIPDIIDQTILIIH